MGASFVRVAPDSTGKLLRTLQRLVGGNTVEEQYVIVGDPRDVLYRGRASTFRTPGRAATTQNLLTIYNASATRLVDVKRIMIDAYTILPRVYTTHPPIARVSRFTTAPTNGTTLGTTSLDTAETSDANVTVRGDASADGTASGTGLTVTIPAGQVLTQEIVPRLVFGSSTTAPTAGFWSEVADRMEFFVGDADITLRQNQGVVLHLAAGTAMTANEQFTAVVDWEEYTLP